MDCLAEAHNQMLFYIYDPRHVFNIMEENPLHSKDVNYGVPVLYRELLEEIIEQVQNPDAIEDQEPFDDESELHNLGVVDDEDNADDFFARGFERGPRDPSKSLALKPLNLNRSLTLKTNIRGIRG